MISVRIAVPEDLEQLVELQSKLFQEDAAVHDTYIDLSWSAREGRGNLNQLISSEAGLVLAAEDGPRLIGLLVGYIADSSPTRHPVKFANLRDMYVNRDYRRRGVGERLTEAFTTWATESGCVEAHVSSYVANEPAQTFYERSGFARRSVTRVLPLQPS